MSSNQYFDFKKIRKQVLKLSQTEMGKLLNVSMRTIQDWEKDGIPVQKIPFIQKNVYKILKERGLSVDDSVTDRSKDLKNTKALNDKLEDIAKFADANPNEFWSYRYFSQEIDIRVAKRMVELTSDPNKFRDWLNNKD